MFKDIPGYEGLYKINESGIVIKSENNYLMHPQQNEFGRLRVYLRDSEGNRKCESLHRLVAKTFLPNPDNLPVVMHLDNDPKNDHVSNLKWGTPEENMAQAVREGRMKGATGHHHCVNRNDYFFHYQVYNEDCSDIIVCDGHKGVADLIGYNKGTVSNLVSHNKTITQGKYKGYKVRKIQRLYRRVKNDV